jgi:hypothetical protein
MDSFSSCDLQREALYYSMRCITASLVVNAMEHNEVPEQNPEESKTVPHPVTGRPVLAQPRSDHPTLTRAGLGRLKGATNKLTRAKRDFLDKIIGMDNTQEREEFLASIRQQFMDGSLSPMVQIFILETWLGKPKLPVEFSGEVGISRIVREIVDPILDAGADGTSPRT